MRHAKVIEVQSEFVPRPYLQLQLPDGSRAAVPVGLDVKAGEYLVVVSEYGTSPCSPREPTCLPVLKLRRDRQNQKR